MALLSARPGGSTEYCSDDGRQQLLRSAESGDPIAKVAGGVALITGCQGFDMDIPRGVCLIKEAADLGKTEAEFYMVGPE